MAYDPIHQLQLYTRRAGQRLSGQSLDTTRLDGRDEAARERYLEAGYQTLAGLSGRIEALTGCSLEARRALDFGCGVGRLSLPLAARCEHVYGLDVSPAVLREADSRAQRANLTNVEWMDASRLAELSGQYDLVISLYVFQHIPSREGERIFAMLLEGLRPGGVGAIHVTLRPSNPLGGMSRGRSKSAQSSSNPLSLIRGLGKSYPYMLMHSYSLNRLGRLLADAGVYEWNAKWRENVDEWRSYETATIIFRKD